MHEKEGTVLFMVIWHWAYSKGPFKQQERKAAATTTWASYSLQLAARVL